MQVARKPNRRPWGLVLVCLVVLCLTVPRYWQARNAARLHPESGSPSESTALVWEDLGENPFAVEFSTFGEPPSPSDRPVAVLDGDLFAELIAPPRTAPTEAATQPMPFWVNVLAATTHSVSNWLQDGGQQLAHDSADQLATWMSRAAELQRPTAAPVSPGDLGTTELPTLRLTDPRERLAMAPRKRMRLPSFSELVDDGPSTDNSPAATWSWSRPAGLFDQLQVLAECPPTAEWAGETLAVLNSLTGRDATDRPQTAVLIERLDGLADEAARLSRSTRDERLRVELLRAHWGLARRIDCWSKMCDVQAETAGRQRVAALGSLHGLLSGSPETAAPSVDLQTLSAGLEAYEQTGKASVGRAVRAEQIELLASDDATERQLGETLEKHYRNANLRIAVTAELLNRYLSQDQVTVESVRDCIVGTPVRGRSETTTSSRVHLEPATGLLKLALETEGTVNSNTLADGGQAVLHSLSTTNFWVREPIVVDREAIHAQPPAAHAENYSRLVGIRTMYDWVPLLGEYAHAKAMDEYRAKRPRAKAEVECKVAGRASQRVNDTAQQAIDRVEQEVRERFTARLSESGIEITPIELTTTSDRLIARLRMASDGQLAAHSPRPRAPADSLASLQIHQSALTNAATALDLNGRRLTAPELQQKLRDTFPRMAKRSPQREVHEDTVFDFADRDAIQFRVADGRAELLILLKEFVYEGHTSRRFIVHAFYRPVIDGLEAKLVRDGALGIEGRLRAGDRARLHNVFETVLSADRPIPVFRVDDPHDPRLAGLMITQLVLEDGWAGIAIGPTGNGRVAQRWRSLR